MKNITGRFCAFLIGLVFILVLLEILLRGIGVDYKKDIYSGSPKWHRKDSSSRIKDAKVSVILCLGNSYTYGLGAPVGKAYPDHLQRMVDSRFGSGKVVVINGGVPNQNTAELLSELEDNIKRFRPRLIILQTGERNWINYHKIENFLRRERIVPRNRYFSGYDFLYNSHVFRLGSFLWKNVIKGQYDISYRQEKEYQEIVNNVIRQESVFRDKKKADEAIKYLKRCVGLDSEWDENYLYIGRIYFLQENYDEALTWFCKIITRKRPDYTFTSDPVYKAYSFIREMRQKGIGKQKEELGRKIDLLMKRVDREDAFSLEWFKGDEIRRWFESDIKEIVRIAREGDVKIILQNYPFASDGFRGFVNSALPRLAEELNVPFQDTAKTFQDRIRQGARHEDYFAPDGHCNSQGYELMAGSIFDKLAEIDGFPFFAGK